MKIQIRYRQPNSEEWLLHPISPSQYFEHIENENFLQWDDVPNHLHAVDFLSIPRSELSETKLQIWDPDDCLRVTLREFFWNEGWNVFIQRTEPDFELFVIQVRIDGSPLVFHTIRISFEATGSFLLEHLRAIETEKEQVPGDSEVFSGSIPIKEGECILSMETEIYWNQERSYFFKHINAQKPQFSFHILSQDNPVSWYNIKISRNSNDVTFLTHDI